MRVSSRKLRVFSSNLTNSSVFDLSDTGHMGDDPQERHLYAHTPTLTTSYRGAHHHTFA